MRASLLILFFLLIQSAAGAQPAGLGTAAQTAAVRVSGTVTDETGGVMQAVTVRLYQSDGTDPIRATTTDGDGSFAVEVPAGEYRVKVSAPDFQMVEQTIRAAPGLEALAVTLPLDVVEVVVGRRRRPRRGTAARPPGESDRHDALEGRAARAADR